MHAVVMDCVWKKGGLCFLASNGYHRTLCMHYTSKHTVRREHVGLGLNLHMPVSQTSGTFGVKDLRSNWTSVFS